MKIVAAAVLSRKRAANIDFQSARPAGLEPAEPKQRTECPLGTQAACLCSIRGSFPDHLPRLAQMFFRCEHVTQTNPHHCSAAQFCLCEVGTSGSVDLLH